MAKYDFKADMRAYQKKQQRKMYFTLICLLLVLGYFVLQGVRGNAEGSTAEEDHRPSSYYKPSVNNYQTKNSDGTIRQVRPNSRTSEPADPDAVYTARGKVVSRAKGRLTVRTSGGSSMSFTEPAGCPEVGAQVEIRFSGPAGSWTLESIAAL